MATKKATAKSAAKKSTKKALAKKAPSEMTASKSLPATGKDPRGGLTQAGRDFYNAQTGGHLKPGVKGAADTPEKKKRKGIVPDTAFHHSAGTGGEGWQADSAGHFRLRRGVSRCRSLKQTKRSLPARVANCSKSTTTQRSRRAVSNSIAWRLS